MPANDTPEPGRGFAMVPAWLAWKQPTANEVLVYVHLALFGTFNPGTATYEQCRPSKKTLAHGDERRGYPGTGLGEQTVARALRGLEDLGAIKGEPSYDEKSGAQGPTVYRLVFGQVMETAAPISPLIPAPGIRNDRGGVSRAHTPGGVQVKPRAGITSDTQPITSNQEPNTKREDPPLPPDDEATRPVDLDAPGGDPDFVEETPSDPEPDADAALDPEQGLAEHLNAAVDAAVAARAGLQGWSVGQVRAALRETLTAGHDPWLAAATLTRLAADRAGTRYPGRLCAYLGTLAARAQAGQVSVGVERAPVRMVEREAVRCRTHPGQPAANCGGCRGDQLAALVDEGVESGAGPVDGEVARAQIREITKARAGRSGVGVQRAGGVSDLARAAM